MTKRIFLPILCLVFILSIGGVSATWKYATGGPSERDVNVSLSLSTFDYPPEEILPGGGIEEVTPGENHFALIDRILNEKDKSYGLNINNNVLLHQYLRQEGVVYSNQKVQGGNLKFILDPKNNTHGLYYCIEKVSDTLYYCYTFSTNELSTAAGSSVEITAYRTLLEKKNKWEATTSHLGYAKTASLSSLGFSADPNTIAYSIDISTWHTK